MNFNILFELLKFLMVKTYCFQVLLSLYVDNIFYIIKYLRYCKIGTKNLV